MVVESAHAINDHAISRSNRNPNIQHINTHLIHPPLLPQRPQRRVVPRREGLELLPSRQRGGQGHECVGVDGFWLGLALLLLLLLLQGREQLADEGRIGLHGAGLNI